MFEMLIKMYGLGARIYFTSSFNIFDCVVSIHGFKSTAGKFCQVEAEEHTQDHIEFCVVIAFEKKISGWTGFKQKTILILKPTFILLRKGK